MSKQVYNSHVTLGAEYEDQQTKQRGIAKAISFYLAGCERVTLQWVDDNKTINSYAFDAPTLVAVDPNDTGTDYESDIILGEKYEDRQTRLRGFANTLTFHQHAGENATLEYLHDGELKDSYLDVARLENSETKQQAKTERTGGPARGSSHVRPSAPTRR